MKKSEKNEIDNSSGISFDFKQNTIFWYNALTVICEKTQAVFFQISTEYHCKV